MVNSHGRGHRRIGQGVLSPLLRARDLAYRTLGSRFGPVRWLRRLLPFIICHFVWDASIGIHSYVSTAAAAIFVGTFFVAALVCTIMWSREPAASSFQPLVA